MSDSFHPFDAIPTLEAKKLALLKSRLLLRLVLVFGGVLLPLLLFGTLAEDVWDSETLRWDSPILQRLHAHATPQFDAFMLLASWLGGTRGMVPLVLAVAAVLGWKRCRAELAFLAAGVGGACLLNIVAKLVFGRTRPDLWLSIAPEFDYSFPSGHAMLSMAVTATLLFLLWHLKPSRLLQVLATIVGALFVGWVGLSRLYLGVHFPSDILAGWCASLIWVTCVHLIFRVRRSFKSTSRQEMLQAARLALQQEFQTLQQLKRDARTPRVARILLGVALRYTVLPFGLIPDFIPLIGHLDDAFIIPLLVVLALAIVPRELIMECRMRAREGEKNAAPSPAGKNEIRPTIDS